MIQSSRDHESFIRLYRLQFENWAFDQIPDHLPEGGYEVVSVSEDGMKKTVKAKYGIRECKDGWIEIISVSVKEALDDIIARPDEKNTLNKIKILQRSLEEIDLWDDNWIVNTFNYYCTVLREKELQNTDAYIILHDLIEQSAIKLNRQAPPIGRSLKAFKWEYYKCSLIDFLEAMKQFSHLFKDGSLEGLKIALSGKELTADDWGVLELVIFKELTRPVEFIYLLSLLLDMGFIKAKKPSMVYAYLTGIDSPSLYSNTRGKILSDDLGVSKIKDATGINYKWQMDDFVHSLRV